MRRSFDSRRSFDADVLQRSIRSGWADVKGVGISQYYHFFTVPRIWVCLTEEQLLFFKDSTSGKPISTIKCCEIREIRTSPARPHVITVLSSRNKEVSLSFKTALEADQWRNEIEQCLSPVICIGGDISSGIELPHDYQTQAQRSIDNAERTDLISLTDLDSPDYDSGICFLQRARSPKRDSNDSTVIGSAFAFSAFTGTTKRDSTFYYDSGAKFLKEEVDDYLKDFSDFDHKDDCANIKDEETFPPVRDTVRAPSPLDPELVFGIERVYIAVSGYPVTKTKSEECEVEDLTGKVVKLFEHPSAIGGCSDVWKGRLRPEGGGQDFVAVKVIRSFAIEEEKLNKVYKRLEQELDIWKRLKHPNIVPLLGIAKDFGRFPSMISPWIANGSAAKYFEKLDIKASLHARLKLLYEVACGLEYLHSFYPPIVHGDLKASNVLVSETGQAMLTDFGISRVLEEAAGCGHESSSFNGSVRWMAFELIKGHCEGKDDSFGDSVSISTMTDIWAFGSTMLEILSGKLPYFYRKNDVQVMHEIMLGLRPLREDIRSAFPSVPEKISTFLHTCWHENPRSRPSVTECKSFIQSILREQKRMGAVWECDS